MLLFLYMLVGNGLSSCFVVPTLGGDVGGLRDIVSVYDWGSRLVRGLCLVPVYRLLVSIVSRDVKVRGYGVWVVCVWDVSEICRWWGREEDFL